MIERQSPLLPRFLLVGLLYLAGGVLATGSISHPVLVSERTGLILMLRGEAHNPFARRVLSLNLVRGIRALTPAPLRALAERRGRALGAGKGGSAEAIDRSRKMEGYWDYALAEVILNVVCFTAFLFVLRGLFVALFRPPPLTADLFPLVALLAVPVLAQYGMFVYDYPQMLLYTLGLYLLATRRDRAFLALLPIGMLNKETFVILPLLYGVSRFGTLPTARLVRSLAIQLAVCVVVFAGTVVLCHGRSGGVVEDHLAGNLRSLVRWRDYFRFSRIDPSPLFPGGVNLPVPTGWNLPALAVLSAFVAAGWRSAPAFLKWALLTTLAPLVTLAFFFGLWHELRDYLEAVPILVLLVYAGIARIWRVERAAA